VSRVSDMWSVEPVCGSLVVRGAHMLPLVVRGARMWSLVVRGARMWSLVVRGARMWSLAQAQDGAECLLCCDTAKTECSIPRAVGDENAARLL
jgi:hypothetical protein